MQVRLCPDCGVEKPLTAAYWHKDKNKKSGFRYNCKECRSKQRRKTEPLPVAKKGFKVCTRCREEFPATAKYFFRDASTKDGLYCACKYCTRKTPLSRKKGYKICIRCLRELPKTRKYFSKNQSSSDGFLGYCKECQGRTFILKQKYLTASDKDGYKICSRCGTELLLNEDNFHKAKTSKDGFVGICKECVREYRHRNRDRERKRYREYRIKNKDILNIKKTQRNALREALISDFSLDDWNDCLIEFDNSCAYCGMTENEHLKEFGEVLHQEHFVAIVKGGNYTKDNIIPSCKSCNCSKRDRDFFEWYKKQEFYSKKREEKILNYLIAGTGVIACQERAGLLA